MWHPVTPQGLLVGLTDSTNRTSGSRYVACPSNGHDMHAKGVDVAAKVRRGPKGYPHARCPVCGTKVFLPWTKKKNPDTAGLWIDGTGFTEEQCSQRGLVVLER